MKRYCSLLLGQRRWIQCRIFCSSLNAKKRKIGIPNTVCTRFVLCCICTEYIPIHPDPHARRIWIHIRVRYICIEMIQCITVCYFVFDNAVGVIYWCENQTDITCAIRSGGQMVAYAAYHATAESSAHATEVISAVMITISSAVLTPSSHSPNLDSKKTNEFVIFLVENEVTQQMTNSTITLTQSNPTLTLTLSSRDMSLF